MRLVCMDPFMSHVLEKLLILLSFDKSEEANNKTTPDQLLKDKEWVLKVCRFVTNNLEDFSLDMYASHLLRTCVQCLTGHRIENKGNPSDSQRTEGYNIRTVWKFSKEHHFLTLRNDFNLRASSRRHFHYSSQKIIKGNRFWKR